MRKIVLIALVAWFAGFQGEVCAEMTQVESYLSTNPDQNGIGEIELEWVLNQVVDQTGMTYDEVRNLYNEGSLEIKQSNKSYEVNLRLPGGTITVLIENDL